MRGVLTLLLLSALVIPASAAEETLQPANIVDAYLTGLVSGDAAKSFDALMTHSRIDEEKPLEIGAARGQISQAMQLYGKPSGYESISEVRYGTSITRLIYITKHSDIALVWNFYFYKAESQWSLLNFDFNDRLQKLD